MGEAECVPSIASARTSSSDMALTGSRIQMLFHIRPVTGRVLCFGHQFVVSFWSVFSQFVMC